MSPIVLCLENTNKTDDLLKHEQGHYDIGILVGRAFVRELESLTAPTGAALNTAVQQAYNKHVKLLMPAVQAAYDTETDHSQKGGPQARWDALIAAALTAPSSVATLNALPL